MLEMAFHRLCHNRTSHFSQFTITQIHNVMTPYVRKIVFYKLYIWHLFLDFFFCFFFQFLFYFFLFLKFSYKIVQNYSALIEDFVNPNKKSVYLTVLFIHWKQFGTLGFCIDGKASHFFSVCPWIL